MKKDEQKWHPMTEHPSAGTKVEFIYEDSNGYSCCWMGKWDGENWLSRKPYTIDECEPVGDIKLLGWVECDWNFMPKHQKINADEIENLQI